MNDQVKPYPLVSEAIRNGDGPAMQALFAQYPEIVSLRVPAFGTWLHYASAKGTLDLVKRLIAMGFDVNARDREGLGPLQNAAFEGKEEIAEHLLDQGARMDVSASVRNPLFGAVISRSPEIARLLLDRGIDSKVRYDSETMENMDAVAFAMMRGERDIAHMIALHNAGGDETAARAAMAESFEIARKNTSPVGTDDD